MAYNWMQHFQFHYPIESRAIRTDNIQMQQRRKMLLFHGVEELMNEDTTEVVINILRNYLNFVNLPSNFIRLCIRIGNPIRRRPKSILVEFAYTNTRDQVYKRRLDLIGTGINVTEFLTKRRYDLFKATRLRFGSHNCWTRAGNIYLQSPRGVPTLVRSMTDLLFIEPKEYFDDTDSE